MLHQLRSRLHSANFAVHFAIVTAEISDDKTMAELSRASAGVPLVSFDTLPESSVARIGWNRYSNDVMVIDSCGRLTYQVVMPWSSLQYPYVKAAVISTLIDQPCGPCNATEKKPKLAESRTLNATLHEMQESRNKTQSKLASIVNQYKPRREDEETEEVKEHARDAEDHIIEGDIITETNGNSSEMAVNDEQQAQLTEIPNAMEINLQTDDDTHTSRNEEVVTTEIPEKMSKGKKKLSHKKNRSKLRTKHTKEGEITEELPKNLPAADLELEKSIYSSAENYISSEVTLAPLRETKDGLIPIRVIMRSPHEHAGKTYDYLEMQLGNPGYHGHLEGNERESELQMENEQKELQLAEDDLIGGEDKIIEDELKKGDGLIGGYGDLEMPVHEEKGVGNNDKDLIMKHAEDMVIDAVHVGATTSQPEGADKNLEAKKKNKKTEKGDKKAKGKKTKLTNIPEQEWMKAESKDVPDKFDDIYPQVNDFANDVREEESNHKNDENVLDDLTVTDLKYLIEEMGLEVNTTKELAMNSTFVTASAENKNGSSDSQVDAVKKTEVTQNGTGEQTNDKKGHHKSATNFVSISEKGEKTKDSKGKDTVAKDSDEIVNRTKVTLTPTLSESNDETTSGSDGSSKELMEHYSKLLPWIDYHL